MRKFFVFLFGLFARFSALSIFGSILFLGIAYFTAISAQEQAQTADPKVVGVDIVREQSDFVISRQFAGRLNAIRVSDLAFELGGELVEILVEEGERVDEGQVLARLDIDELTTRRQELRASRREAQARFARAQATFERVEELVPEAATPQQLDDIRGERDAIRAQVDQLSAALETLDVSIDNSSLTAPFEGEIVIRYLDEGAVVSGGQSVLRLNGGGALEAEIGIPARFRNQITIGETYTLTAGALRGEGMAKRIVNDIDLQTRTITVLLTITEDPGFVPSDLVRIGLNETIRARGMWVSNSALIESIRGLWAVFTVEVDGANEEGDVSGRSGIVMRNDIEIVHTEENRSFVRGTLEDGAYVVHSSPFRFVPGQKVTIETAIEPTQLPGPENEDDVASTIGFTQ